MSSKSRFGRFKKRTFVEHPMPVEEGEEPEILHFYPASVAMGSRLREFGGDLADCLGKLTTSSKEVGSAVSTKTSEFGANEDDGTPVSRIVEETYDPPAVDDMLKKAEFSGAAWREMAETLLDPKNVSLICEVVLDSQREELRPQDRSEDGTLLPSVVDEFRRELDIPTLLHMTQGWLKANTGDASDVGKILTSKVKEALGAAVKTETEEILQGPGSSTTEPGD